MSSQSLNTASTTSLSPSIANLNALASPKPSVHPRRLTAPPPTSLGLPEPVSPQRPRSPLRNDFIPRRNSQDSHSGDDDDADRTWVRSQSPTSVTQFAANLAQRVGSLISPAPGSRALPSDAELEAEAQRERDRSRREAERILTREAEERRAVEERVLAMMNGSPQSLPPPRGRSQTLPNPPSPASSTKEGPTGPGWWQAAKSRLTPTKESLTPAQQVVEEARSRSREVEKEKKNPKGKDKDWPASPSGKYADPAFLNLKIPHAGSAPRASSPTSPTPDKTPMRLSPAPAAQPINISPISLQRGTSPGGSPAREQPPMYASFSPSGTLDVAGTLLTVAKRFEKLERWTVSHVRALEERMGDVERWLVDKENERTKEKEQEKVKDEDKVAHPSETDLGSIRDDITELQGRITELGREMARFATSPAVLSTNTAVHESPELRSVPPTESLTVSAHESSFTSVSSTSPPGSGISTPAMNVLTTPRRVPSLTARESTSPPLARVGPSKTSSRARTRLPYPTGDYTSPGDVISPTHTPASSPPAASRPTSVVMSGLPPMSPPFEFPAPPTSPPTRVTSPTPSGLPPPNMPGARRGSVSPTPLSGGRKRYTVALGGPIVAPPEVEAEYERERTKTLMGTAYFSTATESSEDDDDEHGGETVGKKGAARAAKLAGTDDWYSGSVQGASTTSSPRARAQSTYAASSLQSNQAALSKHRLRSQSTDFRTDNVTTASASVDPPMPNRFVDPLVLRRQSKSDKHRDNKPLVGPGKKVPVGQLVAFFDSERSTH
ncbi:hypothetical protein OG21DRAFT_1432801 [Imleria badia]|nr:hypothetical protein OG21DRAFT_1432801 [Imleria badia]